MSFYHQNKGIYLIDRLQSWPCTLRIPKPCCQWSQFVQTWVIVIVYEKIVDLLPLRNRKLTFLKLFILVFYFTLVMQFFYPLNLNFHFVILNEVSRIFIWTMFWFQQIKLLKMLQLFYNCIISILLSVSSLTPMPINCSLLWVIG